MNAPIPKTMKAAVIDRFGGPEVFRVASIPVPDPDEGEVLIHVRTAGIGAWDPWLREGGSSIGAFPQVLGTDGAGIVAAAGKGARRFKVGDRVYGFAFDNPKGGFYAEYAAVPEGHIAAIPENVSTEEAGALAASGLTALAGIESLKLGKERTLLILGASGGVGHVALQLAKRTGSRLLAVASGKDGVELVRRLGADEAVNGRSAGFVDAVKKSAPDGVDFALAFANSETLGKALRLVKKGGSVAYPNGVEPEPKGLRGIKIVAFDGVPSRNAYDRLNALISKGLFRIEIGRAYRLEDAARAHRDIQKHHLGKLAFQIED
jgi:NADPH:quinone reductase-like Zn-dependent oxidoreductase